MKKIYSIIGIALLGVVAFLISCERDNEAILTTLSVTNEDYKMSYTSAIIACHISSEATLGNVYLHYSTRQDFEEYDAIEMYEDEGMYHTQLTDLQDNTIYYIRYAASNRFSSIIGDDVYQIQTLKPSVPCIIFDTITTIWDTYANIQFHLEFDGGAPLSEMGIRWNKESVPTIESNTLSTKDTFATLKISDLQPNTMYYVRAYATNKVGIAYSEEHKFLTYDNPKVETRDVTEINLTSALLSGELKFNGNDKSTTVGFCWSESSQPTLSNNHKEVSYTSNIFKHQVSNLKDETKYYVRAYAQNKIGIVYGEEKSFTTNATSLPTITTSTITQITETSAVAGGNITNDGGAEIQERGVVYSTTEYPTTSNNKVQSGNGTGSFTCNLTNLSDETTYYVRAYAINKKGTAYGEQVSFKTKAYNLPTVTTNDATNILYHSASIGGNVTNDGGAEIQERGIVYSTTEYPTTSNNKIQCSKGTGSFTCNLTNLSDETTYYVRAYAINKKGTAYGKQVSFKTKAYSLPTVTTNDATNILYHSASIGGNVTNDGGVSVTERGFVYGTSQNPTISNNKIISGTGTGTFTCELTGLLDGTNYYVRAYAINKKGVAYGEQKTFTTKAYQKPTVTTTAVSNITFNSVTIGGTVSSDGGASITERGVVYSSTTPNPTINQTVVKSHTNGLGSFTCYLTGLMAGTTYYVRAYAKNAIGISYGASVQFKTSNAGYVTVKAIVPPHWTETITAWVWSNNNDGRVVYPTIENGWYVVTEYCTALNIIFRNGTDWNGNHNQTVDIVSLHEDVCLGIGQSGTSKAIYTLIDCETNPNFVFSVSSNKTVIFSSGNLQCHSGNDEWRFADNQWDYIDRINSSNNNGWYDLFGWSTSSSHFGSLISDYFVIYSGSFVDWGTNKISNDTPNTWRTLTYDEWKYVVFDRSNADNLKGVAEVNDVNGLILLPDNWICPADITFKPGFHSDYSLDYSLHQSFTADQWSLLESTGAVFLPGSYDGCYWSSTESSSSGAYCLGFHSDEVYIGSSRRNYGMSVRLVKDY